VDRNSQLTPLGRQLARLPVDPRMGRMLLEAAKLGSLQEVLIVASAMSIRTRASVRRSASKRGSGPRAVEGRDSDFAGLVNLWRGFEEQRQALTASPLRNWCRKNFLNYLRLREWRDSHRQLSLICRDMQLSLNKNRRITRNCTRRCWSACSARSARKPKTAITSAPVSGASGFIRRRASARNARSG
jgi:ATP-dependent helicase HrpA